MVCGHPIAVASPRWRVLQPTLHDCACSKNISSGLTSEKKRSPVERPFIVTLMILNSSLFFLNSFPFFLNSSPLTLNGDAFPLSGDETFQVGDVTHPVLLFGASSRLGFPAKWFPCSLMSDSAKGMNACQVLLLK